MAITKEQVYNVINYFVMNLEKDKLSLFLSLNEDFQNLDMRSKEQAISFAKMLALNLKSKTPGEENSDKFIIDLALAIREFLAGTYNNHSFDGIDGAFELVQIIEKEKGLI